MDIRRRRQCFFYGCIFPFIIVFAIMAYWICFDKREWNYYIPDIGLYLKIVQKDTIIISVGTKQNTLSDSIEYCQTGEYPMMILYYKQPNHIYIDDVCEPFINKLTSHKFQITMIQHDSSEQYIHKRIIDGLLGNYYSIVTNDFSYGIAFCLDPDGNKIKMIEL